MTILDRSRVEIKLGDYGTSTATALSDSLLLSKVQEYRRLAGARMQPLDREGMLEKIPAAEYHVSRKVDGEFTVLVFRDGEIFSVNPGGTVRVGLPFMNEAAKLLTNAGVKDVMLAGELYALRDASGRPRVHDVSTVARKPQSTDDLQKLRFAVFDVISKDGVQISQPFAETWKLVQKWFGLGGMIHPVESKPAKDVTEITKLFEAWVDKDGAEGLVVRSDASGIFKVKPRHTLDLAVLGFAESVAERQGMLHDMLLGVKRNDGTLQMLGRVGGGFSDDQRRSMLSDLKDMVVESEYAEVNADHVAYQMVQPEWVVEVSCLDLISETTRGGSVNRMVLDYQNNGSQGYQVVTKLPLATIISPQFVRRRDDKQVRAEDCGIRQVAGIVEVPLLDRDARQMTLPCSEILRREVFVKEQKGQSMVRKFLMWKTNKELESDEFAAFVLHFTDFSPNRKDALARELRVSNSAEQMEQLWKELQADNIKAGWNKQGASTAVVVSSASEPAVETTAATTTAETAAEPTTKKPRKKTASKSEVVAEPVAETPTAADPSVEQPEGELAPSERKKGGRKKKSG